jgi:uncharacterized protein YjbI with pentapeptide repeats
LYKGLFEYDYFNVHQNITDADCTPHCRAGFANRNFTGASFANAVLTNVSLAGATLTNVLLPMPPFPFSNAARQSRDIANESKCCNY